MKDINVLKADWALNKNNIKHKDMIAYGPVSSRRFGKSLGINNIPSKKVCSYSCVYCQLGKTQHKQILRESFYKAEKLSNEVEKHLNKLDDAHSPDFLTFVANGEPTLDINIGNEIRLLKMFKIPVAVISNASLIHDKSVQDDLMEADCISVKIDTLNERIWQKINRPVRGLDFNKYLKGLEEFSRNYKGKLYTETMLLDNINSTGGETNETASFIKTLHPGKAYLSVPTRPPAEKEVKPVNEELLNEAYQIFQSTGIYTELLTGFEGTDTGYTGNAYEDILNIAAVHPLREDTIKEILKNDSADFEVIESLLNQKIIKQIVYKGKKYYVRNYH